MKKKTVACFLAALFLLAAATPAMAETYTGGSGWAVVFTADNKMESTFTTGDLTDAVYGMQPGDTILLSLELENRNGATTDWYMTNQVLQSLEDKNANARGGAYTYRLAYTAPDGQTVTTLYDSDTVGGEAENSAPGIGLGLHEATSALKDYFYLDTLAQGQKAVVTLEIGLDGETQDNGYQNTLADLQMNFAVELRTERDTPNTPPGDTPEDTPKNPPEAGKGSVVKTGDESQPVIWIVLMLISGILLVAVSVYSWKTRRKGED